MQKTLKEEKEPDNSNNEFSCNKCGKMFSVDNTIQGIHNLSKMLMTHSSIRCSYHHCQWCGVKKFYEVVKLF